MKKLSSALLKKIWYVLFLLSLGFIIALGSGKKTNYAANIGSATSLQAVHFVSKYDDTMVEEKALEVKPVSNMDEVAQYGPLSPVMFTGQMTAYTAYCPGCIGKVACPPAPDVRNGNIYYEDSSYGTVRILAADRKIPCGSIIKISNLTFSNDPILGIVLDRGGAIKGNIIDFLVEERSEAYDDIGRQRNVIFEIIRWGW